MSAPGPLEPGYYSAEFAGVDAKGNPIIDMSTVKPLNPNPHEPKANVSRVEVEMSTGWGTSHPELMVKSIIDFQLNHPVKEWCHTINLSRIGFVTLIAHRRK